MERIDLTLIVIPDRNNDQDYAMAYTGINMTGGVKVSLELANGIVLAAKEDDMLYRVSRRTHAYKSKKYFAHYQLNWRNGYGRLLPADALVQLQERRQQRVALRERTAVVMEVA